MAKVVKATTVANENAQPSNETIAPVVNIKPEPTSEKLTEIRGKIDEAYGKMKSLTDRAEMKAQNLVIYNLEKEETAEIAAIKIAERQAEELEKRNARVQIANDFENAIRESLTFELIYDHNASDYMEKSNALNDVVKTAREKNQNELLAKYGSSTPSKSVATGTTAKPAGEKGATSKAIVELFVANRASGMSDTDNVKAIIDAGFSRGTTGAVVLEYQREIGEKAPKA